MKIPETSANIGAYYGNEENGQWQPNGVIIDNGVGGGVVGSGDAGIHRPPIYPVHIPRGHIPGYVMAGAYYPPAPYPVAPPPQDDFEDYMWMENEEEFDKQVMQQLEEEALMEQCIEAMLEDEQRERHRPVANGHNKHYPTTSNGNPLSLEETVSRSTLNPLAAEFVPTGARQFTVPPEEKHETPEPATVTTPEVSKSTEEQPSTEPAPTEDTTPTLETTTTEAAPQTPPQVQSPPQTETPEVSVADLTPSDKEKRPKEKKEIKKREEPKKAVKQEVKPKAKPQVVKSEPKVAKKKEVKPVKSEASVEEKTEEAPVEVPKPLPSPVEEPSTPGIKPINYAAAAKANKPKKPTTPPATEKTPPPPAKAEKKPEKVDKKPAQKTEKVLPRKNSAK